MKKDEFQEIFDNVEDYVTSSGLNLRISKQRLISEILTLSKEDSIKINISTPVYVKNETKKIRKGSWNGVFFNLNLFYSSLNNLI